MSLLLDTNILTRSAQPAHPMHADAVEAISALGSAGDELCVVPQNLIEFWAVATRPLSANGLEMTTAKAQVELARIKSFFRYLPDTPLVYDEWERLVTNHSVSGKNSYDARIAAAMITHGVTHLLTFNAPDFKRYPEITVVQPSEVSR
jgi:predicted nucleic acid-binding protein